MARFGRGLRQQALLLVGLREVEVRAHVSGKDVEPRAELSDRVVVAMRHVERAADRRADAGPDVVGAVRLRMRRRGEARLTAHQRPNPEDHGRGQGNQERRDSPRSSCPEAGPPTHPLGLLLRDYGCFWKSARVALTDMVLPPRTTEMLTLSPTFLVSRYWVS